MDLSHPSDKNKDVGPRGHPGGAPDGAPALWAIAAAGGDPPAPFVVRKEGGGDEDDGEDAEENLHGEFRIACSKAGCLIKNNR